MALATSLVGAMATDAWEQAREALVNWWRRVRPSQADEVDADLFEAHLELMARGAQNKDAESHLVAAWRIRLTELQRDDPALVDELGRLIDEKIAPLLRREEDARTGSHEFRAKASGHGRVYQAGRDQNIQEP
jgi:hypothetical protein